MAQRVPFILLVLVFDLGLWVVKGGRETEGAWERMREREREKAEEREKGEGGKEVILRENDLISTAAF